MDENKEGREKLNVLMVWKIGEWVKRPPSSKKRAKRKKNVFLDKKGVFSESPDCKTQKPK